MKGKVIFIAVWVLYFAAGLSGFVSTGYQEIESRARFFNDALIWLVLITLAVVGLFHFFLIRVFQKSYKKTTIGNKIGIGIIASVLALFANKGTCLIINSTVGKQEKFLIQGYIESKYYEKSSKGSKSYYVILRDTVSNTSYEFGLNRDIYALLEDEGDHISKEFTIGSLGIIYRSEL